MAKKLYFISGENDMGLDLALENKGDEKTILLIQNAVYFGTKPNKKIADALKQNIKVIALKEDIETRGLSNLIQDGITLIDYDGVIDTTFEHDSILNF